MTGQVDPYARIAPWYDRFLERVDGPVRATAFKMSAPTAAMKVLDVGCGTGATLEQYADAGCDCFGVDASDAMLTQARTRLADRAVLTFGSAEQLAFDDNTFDRVLASMFLHELPGDVRDTVFAELARVVSPAGRIVIADFATGDLALKGQAIRSVSMVLERLAGKSHLLNCRAFLASGGIVAAADRHSLMVESSRHLGGGNMGIYVLQPTANS
ncbi:MAG: methyltransferase domain-containing protein [Actinomycetota bacterium]